MTNFGWLLGVFFVLSAIGTLFVQRYALRQQMVDVPNERSAHQRPTPRGGGLAIVISFLCGFLVLFGLGYVPLDLLIALTGGGLLVATISFWEDHRALPIPLRISVHLAAACWALYWLGGVAPLDLGFATWSWGWFRQVLGIVGLVWLINLYNFMDGIDGIAASEGVFVATAGMLLLGWQSDLSWALGLLAASCAGFLVLNWSPARIFMGDTGSCFLGFAFGVMAIATAAREQLPIWCWVILLGVFLVDATTTLLRRMINRERWYEAHSNHAYQRASRIVGSHLKVTWVIMGINLFWLLPCAYLGVLWRHWAFVIALIALAPLLVIAFVCGAGRNDF